MKYGGEKRKKEDLDDQSNDGSGRDEKHVIRLERDLYIMFYEPMRVLHYFDVTVLRLLFFVSNVFHERRL